MSATRHRLLIVEEEPTLADVTAFRLELLGYEVEVAVSAEGALEAIAQNTPDLMLVDLTLPGMSGLALMETLASGTETAEIPLMAISFNSDLDLVQQAFAVGAADYLVAPYDPLVLESKVERLLASASSNKKTARPISRPLQEAVQR